jgi:hypothetical protein
MDAMKTTPFISADALACATALAPHPATRVVAK